MKTREAIFIILTIVCPWQLWGQRVDLAKDKLRAVNVYMSTERFEQKNTVRVVKDPAVKEFDEATFVRLSGVEFKDGTIEVSVHSKLLSSAPEFARGFIGIAFHISDSNSKFECIYIRPANGRADDQVRRNHAIQYFAYPDYKFQRLRKEFPEKYESYADMGLNEWIRMRIEVKGMQAKLYLNESKAPALVVNDLKLGAEQSGGIGLFVDIGTEGHFADLKIAQ